MTHAWHCHVTLLSYFLIFSRNFPEFFFCLKKQICLQQSCIILCLLYNWQFDMICFWSHFLISIFFTEMPWSQILFSDSSIHLHTNSFSLHHTTAFILMQPLRIWSFPIVSYYISSKRSTRYHTKVSDIWIEHWGKCTSIVHSRQFLIDFRRAFLFCFLLFVLIRFPLAWPRKRHCAK